MQWMYIGRDLDALDVSWTYWRLGGREDVFRTQSGCVRCDADVEDVIWTVLVV